MDVLHRLMKRFQRPDPVTVSGPTTVTGQSLQQWAARLICQTHETENCIQIGRNNYTRTWLLTNYPQGDCYLARLDSLLNFHVSQYDPVAARAHVRLTYHAIPSALPRDMKTRFLRQRQRGMVTATAEEGTPDGATTHALDGYEMIHRAVELRRDSVMELWLGITITTEDPETLDRLGSKLERELENMRMAATPLYQEQVPGLQFSCIVGKRQDDLMKAWPGHLSHVGAISYLTPFLHGGISEGRGCYVGHEKDRLGFRRAAFRDFTRGTGAMNWIIVGRTGEGKSVVIKVLNAELLLEGFTIIQFDANNEYADQCRTFGGVTVDVTGVSGNYLDPLVLAPATGDKDFDGGRFSRSCGVFHAVLRGLVPDLTPQERALADRVLMQIWTAAGVDPDNPATWEGRRASIHDWYGALKKQNSQVAKDLKSKLEMFFEGSQRLFRNELEPTWDGVNYIRILVSEKVGGQVLDEQVAAVQAMMVTHRVWEWVVVNKLKGQSYAMINIDEGQRVLRDPDFRRFIYKAATDGRKHNVGVSICANDPSVFFETEGGRGVWSNATLRLLFFMEKTALEQAAQEALIPQPVVQAVRQMSGTFEYAMSRNGDDWTIAKMLIPQEELDLYHTRGLRGGGGDAA